MICEQAQEWILEFGSADAAVAGHVAGCESCRRFAARQRLLDGQLSRAYAAPPFDPRIRATIRGRVKAEKRRRIWDVAPTVIAPLAGLVTSGVYALFVPELARLILTAGLAISVLSYGGQLLFTWLTEELGEG